MRHKSSNIGFYLPLFQHYGEQPPVYRYTRSEIYCVRYKLLNANEF